MRNLELESTRKMNYRIMRILIPIERDLEFPLIFGISTLFCFIKVDIICGVQLFMVLVPMFVHLWYFHFQWYRPKACSQFKQA